MQNRGTVYNLYGRNNELYARGIALLDHLQTEISRVNDPTTKKELLKAYAKVAERMGRSPTPKGLK